MDGYVCVKGSWEMNRELGRGTERGDDEKRLEVKCEWCVLDRKCWCGRCAGVRGVGVCVCMCDEGC